MTGYSAAFAQLHNAAKAEKDMLPEVADAKADLAVKLSAFAARAPGWLPRVIAAHVPGQEQQILASITLAAGITLS